MRCLKALWTDIIIIDNHYNHYIIQIIDGNVTNKFVTIQGGPERMQRL